MIQIIKYPCCNKIFAACIEPHCYTDKEWLKELKKSSLEGCKISMVEEGSKWSFEKCTCAETIKEQENKNQFKLL